MSDKKILECGCVIETLDSWAGGSTRHTACESHRSRAEQNRVFKDAMQPRTKPATQEAAT